MQQLVFINCMPEDLHLVEGIEKRLELADISFYVPPANLNPMMQKEMVETIRNIAIAHGGMLCILSKKALLNSPFISNIQLMCETAHNERVLVKYQVEESRKRPGYPPV